MRIVIVGLGHAARWLHAPAIAGIDGALIVGGVDRDPQRRDQWATDYPTAVVDDDLDRVLAKVAPSLVVVASPPHLHYEHCRAAIAAQCHVLCEKPFVETLDEADDLIARAAAAGTQIAVNQEFRYMPIFARLAGQIGRAGIGRAVFLHCTQFMDLAPWDEPVAWRASMTNRSLFEGGVHLVDLIHSIVGRPALSVSAHTSSGLDASRDADAIHLVTIDYGGGVLAQITIDRLCKSGTRYVDLRVDCEQASLRASYGGRALIQIGVRRAQRPGVRVEFGAQGLAWVEQGLRRRTIARNPRHATPRAVGELYRHALPAFRAGTAPPVGAAEARETLRIILAAYTSAAEHRPVLLAPLP